MNYTKLKKVFGFWKKQYLCGQKSIMARITLTDEEIQGLQHLHKQLSDRRQADRIKIILLYNIS